MCEAARDGYRIITASGRALSAMADFGRVTRLVQRGRPGDLPHRRPNWMSALACPPKPWKRLNGVISSRIAAILSVVEPRQALLPGGGDNLVQSVVSRDDTVDALVDVDDGNGDQVVLGDRLSDLFL